MTNSIVIHQTSGMTKISRGGIFVQGGGYFGFSARGAYTPLEKTGSSAFRAI